MPAQNRPKEHRYRNPVVSAIEKVGGDRLLSIANNQPQLLAISELVTA